MERGGASPGLLIAGKYRLLEKLGGGGMGDVFRAENVLAGRPVALKLLHSDLTHDTDISERFFQEAQTVNRVHHANIVDVIDAGIAETGPYIVMECLRGECGGRACSRREDAGRGGRGHRTGRARSPGSGP